MISLLQLIGALAIGFAVLRLFRNEAQLKLVQRKYRALEDTNATLIKENTDLMKLLMGQAPPDLAPLSKKLLDR